MKRCSPIVNVRMVAGDVYSSQSIWPGEMMNKEYPKCPSCGSGVVVTIVFGYPSPELIEEMQQGKIALGGCCVPEDEPEWECTDCEHRW